MINVIGCLLLISSFSALCYYTAIMGGSRPTVIYHNVSLTLDMLIASFIKPGH